MKQPEIATVSKKILIGKGIITNLSQNNSESLWKDFIQQKKHIQNRVNENFYSIQVYPPDVSFDDFTPITEFNKWAAVQVSIVDLELLKENDLDSMIIPEGKYAKFIHKGTAQDFFRTSQYIFGTWLPTSGFSLDNRPHFEEMPASYKGPNDPNSEEYVFIPIK